MSTISNVKIRHSLDYDHYTPHVNPQVAAKPRGVKWSL